MSVAARLQVGDHAVGVGVAHPRSEVRPVVVGEPPLGDARELEQEHVPRPLPLLESGAGERHRVADRQRDEVIDPVRDDDATAQATAAPQS